MTSLFHAFATYTSPLINYQPTNAWKASSGVLGMVAVEGSAEYAFYGEGVTLFGRGNQTSYDLFLDGKLQLDYQARHYTKEDIRAQWPFGNCDDPTPGECMVLAEFHGLDPNARHTLNVDVKGNSDQGVTLFYYDTSSDTTVENFSTFPTRIEETSARVEFSGRWVDSEINGQTLKVSQAIGDTATLRFQAYRVLLVGSTLFGESNYVINLDGEVQNTTPTPHVSDNDCVYFSRIGLDQTKEHTLVISNTQARNFSINYFLLDTINELPLNPPDESSTEGNQSGNLSATSPLSGTGPETTSSGTLGPSLASTSSSSLTTGEIVGIVVGSVVILASLVVCFFLFLRRRRRRHGEDHPEIDQFPSQANYGNPSVKQTPSPPLSYFSATPFRLGAGEPYQSNLGTPSKAPHPPASDVSSNYQPPSQPLSSLVSTSASPYVLSPFVPPPQNSGKTQYMSNPYQMNAGGPYPQDSPPMNGTSGDMEDEQINRMLERLARRIGGEPVGAQPPQYQP